MSDLALILAAAIALATGLTLLVVGLRGASKPDLEALLDLDALPADAPLDAYGQRLQAPVLQRILGPLGHRAGNLLAGLLPHNRVAEVNRRLVLAGVTGRVTADEYLAYQVVGLAGGTVVGLILALAMQWSAGGTIALTTGVAVLGVMTPALWVKQSRDLRVEAIELDLPDVLDVLAISVEAGVGFEAALQAVIERFNSPLAAELGHMLSEMELGLSRREALQNLQSRTDVHDLNAFILAMLQADALGMPMREVLTAQAAEMRRRRRQHVREEAAKLPVKLLFPLVIFILPSLFIVILGPAALRIMRSFG